MTTQSNSKANAAGTTAATTAQQPALPAAAVTASQPSTSTPLPTSHSFVIHPLEQETDNSCWAACGMMLHESYALAPLGGTQADLARKLGRDIDQCEPIAEVLKELHIDAGEDDDDYIPKEDECKASLFNEGPLVLTVTEKPRFKGAYVANKKRKLTDCHYIAVSGYKDDKLLVIDPSQRCQIPHEVALPARTGTHGQYANPPSILVGTQKWFVQATYYTNNAGIVPNTASQASTSSGSTSRKRKRTSGNSPASSSGPASRTRSKKPNP
jgi:hypothetical protein